MSYSKEHTRRKHIKNIIESSFSEERNIEKKPVATSYNNMPSKSGWKALSSEKRIEIEI